MTNLTFTTIDTGPNALEKTITLVTGETEAVLIDAGFTRADGHRAVAAVLDAGKRLTTVFISAGDPDFYFGAEVVADAFPDARIVAPADVIEHIAHSYEKKLEAWAHLGANLPTRLVDIAEFAGDSIQIDDQKLQVLNGGVQQHDRGWYLFDPVTHTIVGGVLVFGGIHVWTADTPTVESRAAWLTALDTLEALQPVRVIAGHRVPDFADDVTALQHTRDYLRTFETIIADSATGADAEQALLAAYPGAGLAVAAHLGALVAKGEMTWG